MSDPLLRDIRRVRAQRSRELTRDVHRALAESRERVFTFGHDVYDCSSGEPVLIFKALSFPLEPQSQKK